MQPVPLFCASEVFIPGKLHHVKIPEGRELHFSFFFFFWKAGKESCDLGKERKQKTDTILRQIRFREEDTWKDLENDFFKTAQGPRKGYVCPQGCASSTLKSSALKHNWRSAN